jgi:hypothetical protein
VSRPPAGGFEDAARRIEGWLLDSGVQLDAGRHRGGVAGWLDRDGEPEFVYLEITGYYLTTLAWIARDPASSSDRADDALGRGRAALDWLRSVIADGTLPATRLYLSPGGDDWRNAAVFSFDLAMAARGAACFSAAAGVAGGDTILADLGARLHEVCSDTVPLRSHVPRNGGGKLPDRWSTRPGPHHVKAAAAILRLPPGIVDQGLGRACRETVAHWTAAMQDRWPCSEMHPLLYGLEGLLIMASVHERALDTVEPLYERLMDLQEPDGTLPETAGPGHVHVRADVLAQALRAGALLRAHGRLRGDEWDRRLDALGAALLRHVRSDGAVLFSADREIANAWCAMFAHQALVLHSRLRGGLPVSGEAIELLI